MKKTFYIIVILFSFFGNLGLAQNSSRVLYPRLTQENISFAGKIYSYRVFRDRVSGEDGRPVIVHKLFVDIESPENLILDRMVDFGGKRIKSISFKKGTIVVQTQSGRMAWIYEQDKKLTILRSKKKKTT